MLRKYFLVSSGGASCMMRLPRRDRFIHAIWGLAVHSSLGIPRLCLKVHWLIVFEQVHFTYFDLERESSAQSNASSQEPKSKKERQDRKKDFAIFVSARSFKNLTCCKCKLISGDQLPYLHWETESKRAEMAEIIREVTADRLGQSKKPSGDRFVEVVTEAKSFLKLRKPNDNKSANSPPWVD